MKTHLICCVGMFAAFAGAPAAVTVEGDLPQSSIMGIPGYVSPTNIEEFHRMSALVEDERGVRIAELPLQYPETTTSGTNWPVPPPALPNW